MLDPVLKGLIPRVVEGIFDGMRQAEEHIEYAAVVVDARARLSVACICHRMRIACMCGGWTRSHHQHHLIVVINIVTFGHGHGPRQVHGSAVVG